MGSPRRMQAPASWAKAAGHGVPLLQAQAWCQVASRLMPYAKNVVNNSSHLHSPEVQAMQDVGLTCTVSHGAAKPLGLESGSCRPTEGPRIACWWRAGSVLASGGWSVDVPPKHFAVATCC